MASQPQQQADLSNPSNVYGQVVPALRESVNAWREFVPVVQYLRNPDLKDRHWAKVGRALAPHMCTIWHRPHFLFVHFVPYVSVVC